MWWLLIPILIFGAIAFNAHQSGKELKKDIEKRLD
ncbi:hypothetical protein ES708_27131 [subsurface metagenome]